MVQLIKPGNPIDDALPPHMKRVLDEGNELNVKMQKLQAFLQSQAFKGLELEDRMLLNTQIALMQAYLGVLTQRLHRAQEKLRFERARNTGTLDRH